MAKNALVLPTPPTALVQPTPVYELLFSLALAWWLWQRGKKHLPVSAITGEYLVLSGIGRFLVEFVRDKRKRVTGFLLSTGRSRNLVFTKN